MHSIALTPTKHLFCMRTKNTIFSFLKTKNRKDTNFCNSKRSSHSMFDWFDLSLLLCLFFVFNYIFVYLLLSKCLCISNQKIKKMCRLKKSIRAKYKFSRWLNFIITNTNKRTLHTKSFFAFFPSNNSRGRKKK